MLSFLSLAAPGELALLDVEAADPVVQPGAEACERRARDPEEGLELVRRQLDPEGQTGTRRIQEEVLPKALVREQPAEGPLYISLTHHVLLLSFLVVRAMGCLAPLEQHGACQWVRVRNLAKSR